MCCVSFYSFHSILARFICDKMPIEIDWKIFITIRNDRSVFFLYRFLSIAFKFIFDSNCSSTRHFMRFERVCVRINLNGVAFGTRSLPFGFSFVSHLSLNLICFHSLLPPKIPTRGTEKKNQSTIEWIKFRAQFLPAFNLNIQTCIFFLLSNNRNEWMNECKNSTR